MISSVNIGEIFIGVGIIHGVWSGKDERSETGPTRVVEEGG